MKVLESLNWATEFLEQHGVEHSRRNSELLLCHLLQCCSVELYLDRISLNGVQVKELNRLLDERRRGLPIQYISGAAEFMGLEFVVDSSVFIPRPETELLVETVSKIAHRSPFTAHRSPKEILRKTENGKRTANDSHSLNILDLGTGCGNIAISLTKHLTHCNIIATDISEEVLRIARRNAQLHRVQDRITFFRGNLFEVFSDKKERPGFEIIVSNPPYIPAGQLKALPLEVRCEPETALNGGESGLYYYQRIINDSPGYLVRGGHLLIEIGFGQLSRIRKIIDASGQFRLLQVIKDYQGIERVVVLQWIN